MSGIRARDTKIELAIRKALFARGYRYRTAVVKVFQIGDFNQCDRSKRDTFHRLSAVSSKGPKVTI
ncbi:hypothetical protein ACO2Q1_06650 [Brevundimonas sp. VNH65]|uniref:hypothetical protein n=1 Tax=Brevundimonas sp. VNH65 TaxID=3400917 RepID=UPI003C0DF65E